MILGGIVCLGLLLVARMMIPDPEGMGTHQQLGLPECGFKAVFSVPCPSCGMTTSWSWLTRGCWVESLRSNPGGTMLGIVCTVFGVWMLVTGIRGKWFLGIPSTFWLAILLGSTVAVTLLHWIVRICNW